MKLPTLERLESLGMIRNISTPKQVKNGTTIYEVPANPIKKHYLPKLGIYKKSDGRIIYRDMTSMPNEIDNTEHFIYRVIRELLLLEPKDMGVNGKLYVNMFSSTRKTAKEYIDNMSEEEFEKRIKWVNKIYLIQKLYGEDKYGRQNKKLVDVVGEFKL